MTLPTVDVQALGQSIWIDFISRKMIESGDLKRHVEEFGVVGLTSNPAIFQQAIGTSDDYDAMIQDHLTLDANGLYEVLAVRDIQEAADILRPVYDRTHGEDGYVSLEVSPLLANNTADTLSEAKRLFATVDRPNLMIKIPGTKAGIPAIEAAIAAGININVTLLFSVQNYEAVAEAFIRGLEQRLAAGLPVTKIASVASFFVSRVDAMIDSVLENNIRAATGRDLDRVAANRKLLGKAAIANAKLAYKSYQTLFEGERFAALREAGAFVQRPLWASTGTKNPAYPDTYYVDGLIGKNTVNTVPPATFKAFMDHGTAAETLSVGIEEAQIVLDMLAEVGISLDDVTSRLQSDGVEKFIESFETLMAQVEAKRVVLKTGIIHRQKLALGTSRESVEQTLHKLGAELVNPRIWNKDATVWKDNPAIMEKIANRLGWLDVLKTIDLQRLKAFQATIKDGAFQHVVLLGMGGSSLAPEVLFKTFGQQAGFPDLRVLDSTNPAQIRAIESAVDLSKTLFVVASKSGGTIETASFMEYFWQQTQGNGQQFIAITDPDTAMHKTAQERQFREIFLNPADIGGRYSSLSYFGMVPAALIGLDLDAAWNAANQMFEANGPQIPVVQHPAMWLGAIIGQMAVEGRNKLPIFGSAAIASFGDWAEQLVAESTGKEGRGILPVVNVSVGKPHDYGSDRVFVYLKLEGDPSNDDLDEAIKTLREAGHSRVVISLNDKYELFGEFFRWEYATGIAGRILGVNPFDEPNVTEAKQNTGALLDHYKANQSLPESTPVLAEGVVSLFTNAATLSPLEELCTQHNFNSRSLVDTIAAAIIGTNAGDYFALLAYAQTTDHTSATLREIARRIRHLTRRAVTYNYGPRYLHSTGQLHKGGSNTGIFVVFSHDVETDIEIPGAGYGFGVLHTAQAAGDVQALYDHKCRTLHLHSTGFNIEPALAVFNEALELVTARRV